MNLFNDNTDPHSRWQKSIEERNIKNKISEATIWMGSLRRNGLDPFVELNRPHPFSPVGWKTGVQYHLAICYYYGVEVAQNYFEAAKLYRQAAEQNSAESQYDLSQCYAKGVGVPQDLVEATAWLFVSIHGLEHVMDILRPRPDRWLRDVEQSRIRERKLMLDDLCNQLTDWQMQAAQNRARVILASLEVTWKQYWASQEGIKRRAELDRPPMDFTDMPQNKKKGLWG